MRVENLSDWTGVRAFFFCAMNFFARQEFTAEIRRPAAAFGTPKTRFAQNDNAVDYALSIWARCRRSE